MWTLLKPKCFWQTNFIIWIDNSINIYWMNELHFVAQLPQLVRVLPGGYFILAGSLNKDTALSWVKCFVSAVLKFLCDRSGCISPYVLNHDYDFLHAMWFHWIWDLMLFHIQKDTNLFLKSQWSPKGDGAKFKNVEGLFGCHKDWGRYLYFVMEPRMLNVLKAGSPAQQSTALPNLSITPLLGSMEGDAEEFPECQR